MMGTGQAQPPAARLAHTSTAQRLERNTSTARRQLTRSPSSLHLQHSKPLAAHRHSNWLAHSFRPCATGGHVATGGHEEPAASGGFAPHVADVEHAIGLSWNGHGGRACSVVNLRLARQPSMTSERLCTACSAAHTCHS